jgi:glutathione S-transferase
MKDETNSPKFSIQHSTLIMTDQLLRIVGAPGSPYSRKLRAVLRYRRIPFAWINHGSPETRGLPQARVQLLPQLILPAADGTFTAHTDSSPLIRELEQRYRGRSVIPPEPALAFIDALVEDYADEWLTKAMFHYRWAYAADIAKAAAILPRWFRTNQPENEAVANGTMFAERQIGRLAVVGSNATTAPVIEDSYLRLLAILDAHLTDSRFLFGARPASSDFGLFGQLTQLAAFDPTPAALALQRAPRVVAWVDVAEELSGMEPEDADWIRRDAVPATLRALLTEIGRVYVPFLLANAAAIERGAEQVECVVDGRPWTQRPFPYQGKCLRWLREGYAALDANDRAAVNTLLADTGCMRLFV